MGRVIAILLFSFTTFCANAAADTILRISEEKIIDGSFFGFYTDNLGNLFLLSSNNQIKKLDHNLDSVAVFNDVRRYGDVYSIDVNNPLKVLVYYKDFTTIVTLDRFLNIRNTIDLRNAGIAQAKAVAQSYDNNYWVFDELNNKIKKIDDNGNVLLESADFRNLFSESFDPQKIIDADGALYLYDANRGWRIFDYYGAYKNSIPDTGWTDVSVVNHLLIGRDKTNFYAVNTTTFNTVTEKIDIDLSSAIKIQRQLNRLFVLQKDKLVVYRIQ